MREIRGIERPIQLLVEGGDQRGFFEALMVHLSRTDIQVQDYGGVNEFRSFLSGFVKARGFEAVTSIGVVRDAESNAQGAFQSIQDSLRRAGLDAPENPGERTAGVPDVTVLILPDRARPGMLETVLWEAITDPAERRCVEEFLESMARSAGVLASNVEKASIHAWLATRPKPNVSVGVAAKVGYWDLDHERLDQVREFLSGL